MTSPINRRNQLPENTVIPEDKDLFLPYLQDVYRDITQAVNSIDYNYYVATITSVATDIPLLPAYGSFFILVAGLGSGQPTYSATLTKSDKANAGVITAGASQAGTGTWAGVNLAITSTATAFQIAHTGAGLTGQFNIRIIGTF